MIAQIIQNHIHLIIRKSQLIEIILTEEIFNKIPIIIESDILCFDDMSRVFL